MTPWGTVCVDLIIPYTAANNGWDHTLITITFTEPTNGWIEIIKLQEHEKSSVTSVTELQANAILESIHEEVPDDILHTEEL